MPPKSRVVLHSDFDPNLVAIGDVARTPKGQLRVPLSYNGSRCHPLPPTRLLHACRIHIQQ